MFSNTSPLGSFRCWKTNIHRLVQMCQTEKHATNIHISSKKPEFVPGSTPTHLKTLPPCTINPWPCGFSCSTQPSLVSVKPWKDPHTTLPPVWNIILNQESSHNNLLISVYLHSILSFKRITLDFIFLLMNVYFKGEIFLQKDWRIWNQIKYKILFYLVVVIQEVCILGSFDWNKNCPSPRNKYLIFPLDHLYKGSALLTPS